MSFGLDFSPPSPAVNQPLSVPLSAAPQMDSLGNIVGWYAANGDGTVTVWDANGENPFTTQPSSPSSLSTCSWINRFFNNCTAAELAGQPTVFGQGQPCSWANWLFGNCLPAEGPPTTPTLPNIPGLSPLLFAGALVLLLAMSPEFATGVAVSRARRRR